MPLASPTPAASLAYELMRGACAATLEHLPQLRQAWIDWQTNTAVESKADPAEQSAAERTRDQAIASGEVPPP
jgi:hypothetical protein